jgi:putative membrane protein
MSKFPHALAVVLLLVVGWSAWRPAEWGVWWMEMVWVLGAFAVLAATFRRFRFSNAAYSLVFIWLVMHTVGAHYTFEHVPMEWLKSLLGSERNHYDRIAHFCIGLNSFMLAELALRKKWVSNAVVAASVGVLAIMAMAAGWEIVEWVVAAWDGGADGLAFLGSQGDDWDAQKDMLCDTLGAVSAAAVFVKANRVLVERSAAK